MQSEREAFYPPEEIVKEVEQHVREATKQGEAIDYLTFVPDGEPTLDRNLGKEIDLLTRLGMKIAVITNASLLWREDVREDVCKADWVSVKIDAVTQDVWRQVDRPYGTLRREKMFQGLSEFSQRFNGTLTTESMLLDGINTTSEELKGIADFIAGLHPHTSYLAIPTRPPAEHWVRPATEHAMHRAYHVFRETSLEPEYLIGYEGNAFAFTGNVEEDLLSITSVHPMREDGVQALLTKAHATWDIVEKLLHEEQLIALPYGAKTFYMRTLHASSHTV
jgi:wyosine [tRNA(Phe)-imidazoG37] synthetase (radical SAM superfamily)